MAQSLQLCAIPYLDFLVMLNIEKKKKEMIGRSKEKGGTWNTESKEFIEMEMLPYPKSL